MKFMQCMEAKLLQAPRSGQMPKRAPDEVCRFLQVAARVGMPAISEITSTAVSTM